MLTGQIGLVYSPGFHIISQLIRIITRSPVNHTIIAISETECVGAEPGGAKQRPISYFNTDRIYWSHFDYTEEQRQQIVNWTTAHIGTAYSYLCDAAIGISLTLGLKTPRWIENYLSSDRVAECAQLADIALTNAGIHLFNDNRLPGTVFPGSYIPYWRGHGWI